MANYSSVTTKIDTLINDGGQSTAGEVRDTLKEIRNYIKDNQPDWDETNAANDDFIKNKPAVPNDLTFSGNTLSLRKGGTTIDSVSLPLIPNDLTISGNTLSLRKGGTTIDSVTLPQSNILLRRSVFASNSINLGVDVTFSVPFGTNVGTNNYLVVGGFRMHDNVSTGNEWDYNNDCIWTVYRKRTSDMQLSVRHVNFHNTTSLYFEFALIEL